VQILLFFDLGSHRYGKQKHYYNCVHIILIFIFIFLHYFRLDYWLLRLAGFGAVHEKYCLYYKSSWYVKVLQMAENFSAISIEMLG
jgi:hypothetical protein